MKSTRLLIVGGFLGAGKTTWIEAAAKRLAARGLKPAVITNDQAVNLVDTGTIAQAGLPVAEVAGGCFCCRFEDLTGAALKLRRNVKPDVILAEPVGSCTDLSATVMQPLKQYFSATLSPAPFSVLMDPDRFRDCIAGGSACRLPEDARYIMDKQVEEADVLVLNKADRLSQAEQAEAKDLLEKRFPGRTVRLASAVTGLGMDEWLDDMMQAGVAGRTILEIDYSRYAHGEAVLGWLNATVQVSAGESGVAWDDYGRAFFLRLQERLDAEGAEVAHLKMSLAAGEGRFQANLTSTRGLASFRGEGILSSASAVMTVNARVAMEPDRLRALVEREIARPVQGVAAETISVACFSPAPPTPVHRFRSVV